MSGIPQARPSSRDAILQVFARMVAQRGYAETTLAEVASVVQVSKGTIVHHFGTKEGMLAEVHAGFMRSQLEQLQTIEDRFSDPVDRLAAVVYALLAVHHHDEVAARVFMREFTLFGTSPRMADVRRMRREYDARVVTMLDDAGRAGIIRPERNRLVALQLFGMCNYAWTWYRRDGDHSIDDVAETFLAVFLNGLTAEDREPADAPALVRRVREVVVAGPTR